MRCYLFSLALAALLGLAGAPSVSAQQAAATEPAVQPGDVHTQSSRVFVFVDKTGLGHQHGVEARLSSGTLKLGVDQNAGQLVFDMTSFDADTPAARKYVGLSGVTDDSTRSAVNKNMKGSAVLDVQRFPTATFDVTSAKATGQVNQDGLPLFQLVGQFTLHGTQRPLAIQVTAERNKGWLHVRGGFRIQQTDYGITPYSKALGAIGVADELRIYGELYVAPSQHVTITDIPSRS